MSSSAARTDFRLDGHAGALHTVRWSGEDEPTWVALLCHGYGEHVLRYDWVADVLTRAGAVVYGLDHRGHGTSDGEPVLIEDFEKVVDDFHLLADTVGRSRPGLPVVLIGHSMGGMIAARYAQRHGAELAAVVLSGPVLGSWAAVDDLLALEEIPDVPIDPSTLSRDDAVGAVYVADPLVWHGPFKRPTLLALQRSMATISEAGIISEPPLLWLHGDDDQLVPIGPSRAGFAEIAPEGAASKSYPGARHEIFNETNKDEVLADVLTFVGRYV